MHVLHILPGALCTHDVLDCLGQSHESRSARGEAVSALFVDALADAERLSDPSALACSHLPARPDDPLTGRLLRARIAELGADVVVCHGAPLARLAAPAVGRRDEAISGAVQFASTQQIDAFGSTQQIDMAPAADAEVITAVRTATQHGPRVLAVVPAGAPPLELRQPEAGRADAPDEPRRPRRAAMASVIR